MPPTHSCNTLHANFTPALPLETIKTYIEETRAEDTEVAPLRHIGDSPVSSETLPVEQKKFDQEALLVQEALPDQEALSVYEQDLFGEQFSLFFQETSEVDWAASGPIDSGDQHEALNPDIKRAAEDLISRQQRKALALDIKKVGENSEEGKIKKMIAPQPMQ